MPRIQGSFIVVSLNYRRESNKDRRKVHQRVREACGALSGLAFGVWGLGCRVWGLGTGDSEVGDWGLELRGRGLELRI